MKPALERAARALCALDGHPESTQFDGQPMWESYLPGALAVLKAIHEPSDAMAEAGAEIVRNVGPSESAEAYRSDAANIWRFMIDEALAGHREAHHGG